MIFKYWFFSRLISIAFPVYHRNKITKKRMSIMVLIMTCVGILIPALSFFFEGLSDMYVMIALPLYFTLVGAAYTKIFLVASRKSSVSSAEDENMNKSDRKKKRSLLKDFKLAKACLVVVCFFISFIPGPISYILLDDIDWRLRNAIAVWSSSLIFSNSLLNVSIFF